LEQPRSRGADRRSDLLKKREGDFAIEKICDTFYGQIDFLKLGAFYIKLTDPLIFLRGGSS